MIFCIEGGDACGKATQAKILASRLGCDVLAFPNYGSPTGRAIKGYLQERWRCQDEGMLPHSAENLNALALQCLMTVNRLEHYDRLARASGSSRDHLVLDRYWASALAYGSVEGLDPAWLELVHRGLPAADRWVLLDLDPRVGWERRPERRDRNERDMEKLQKVRGAYLGIFAARERARLSWRVVDGAGSIDEVATRVWEVVS